MYCDHCGRDVYISCRSKQDMIDGFDPLCKTLVQNEQPKPQYSEDDAMKHLRGVLYTFVDVHPDDQTEAFKNALEFYNTLNPDKKILPSGWHFYLVQDPLPD